MEALLASYPELQLKRNMVQCSLSGHEMPARLEVVRAYVKGRKFQKLKTERDFNFQKLEPFITPSLRRKEQLFCALTNRYMSRKSAAVALHLQGKRYKRAMEKYKSGQLVLFTEKLRKKKVKVEEVKKEVEEEEEEEEVAEEEEEEEEEKKETMEEGADAVKEEEVDGGLDVSKSSGGMECQQSNVGMDSRPDSKAVRHKRRHRFRMSSSPLSARYFRVKHKRRRTGPVAREL